MPGGMRRTRDGRTKDSVESRNIKPGIHIGRVVNHLDQRFRIYFGTQKNTLTTNHKQLIYNTNTAFNTGNTKWCVYISSRVRVYPLKNSK